MTDGEITMPGTAAEELIKDRDELRELLKAAITERDNTRRENEINRQMLKGFQDANSRIAVIERNKGNVVWMADLAMKRVKQQHDGAKEGATEEERETLEAHKNEQLKKLEETLTQILGVGL